MENKVRISDYSIHCINVFAADHDTAAKAAAEYVAAKYPGVEFNTERGLTGMYGGALVTGVVHCLRARDKGALEEMARYAAGPNFVAWATELEGSQRYAIIRNTPCPGLVWVRLRINEFEIVEERRSQGAFYDGAEDHPEGAVAWAIAGARARREIVRGYLAEAGY